MLVFITQARKAKAGMKKNLLTVMLSFLKLGAISFGGGAALIPLIEQEVVVRKKWVDTKEFDRYVAVTGIVPASMPVALCSIWDSRFSVLSAYSYSIPGSFIYLVLLTGFSYFGQTGALYLRYASVGLIAFVLFILFRFIMKNYSKGAIAGIKKQYLLIMAVAFVLTCGNSVNRLALMLFALELPVPLFSIDMIHLILLTFFFICFIGNSKSGVKLCAAVPIAVLFALAVGKRGVLSGWAFIVAAVMLVMVAASIGYDVFSNKKKNPSGGKPFRLNYKPLRNLLIFILIAIVVASLVFVVSGDANVWDFALKLVTSALTSFGGGEVYIGISEATFVESGFIPAENFNSQILGIANSMPGPVLMSIATGVGYTYGNINHGTAFGWMFGLMGISLAVTATSFGALLLFTCFELLKDSLRLKMVIKYIIPVVCGMLISTALSLLRQASSVIIGVGVNVFLSVGIVFAIAAVMALISKKFRINDLILIISGGVLTIVALGVII